MVEQETLKTIITGLVFGGLAPYAAYKLIEQLKTWFPDWGYLSKWGVSWAVTLAIAWGAFGLGVALEYWALPVPTFKAWAETLFTIGFSSLTVNQGYHAVKVYLNTGQA
jgi:hypothetical protein